MACNKSLERSVRANKLSQLVHIEVNFVNAIQDSRLFKLLAILGCIERTGYRLEKLNFHSI